MTETISIKISSISITNPTNGMGLFVECLSGNKVDVTAILYERFVFVRMKKNNVKSIKPSDINSKENTKVQLCLEKEYPYNVQFGLSTYIMTSYIRKLLVFFQTFFDPLEKAGNVTANMHFTIFYVAIVISCPF